MFRKVEVIENNLNFVWRYALAGKKVSKLLIRSSVKHCLLYHFSAFGIPLLKMICFNYSVVVVLLCKQPWPEIYITRSRFEYLAKF